MTRRLPTLLLVTLATVGCDKKQERPQVVETTPPLVIDFAKRGASGAQQLPRPDDDITPRSFCPMYAQFVCRKLFACLEPDAIAKDANAHGFNDEPGCQRSLGEFCGSFILRGLEDSVVSGRVKWSGTSYAACFRRWRARGCDEPLGDLPDDPTCREASLGTVSPGGECHTAFDCESIDNEEILCAFPEKGPGECVRLGKVGTRCAFSDTCQQALRCRDSQCQRPGREGEICRFEDDCAKGLTCGEEAARCLKKKPATSASP